MSEKSTYPKISRKIWWLLRTRLKQSIPSILTPTFIISVAEMKELSAKSNVLSPLREMGLIDESNKPSDLLERWRHDDEYNAVCSEIRTNTYPPELVEAFSEPDSGQRDRIKSWFMKNSKVGEVAARMYADTYLLLSEGNPNGTSELNARPAAKKKTKSHNGPEANAHGSSRTQDATESVIRSHSNREADGANSQKKRFPSIHIDVQVHISPDTSSEQIDKIFESMSKHLSSFIDD